MSESRHSRLMLHPRVIRRLTFLASGLFAAVQLCGSGATEAWGQQRDKYLDARLKMVENELVREGISNKAVLKSMRQVPRHLFVSTQNRNLAYVDQALAIGYKQTISPPFIVAYMTESLDPQPDDKVLEIGTGSGYQAAVLSGIVKEVYTIEIVEQLGKNAKKLLKELKYANVEAKVGDGYQGWPEHAPFDKIIVTCSPEKVPQPLIDQLRDGGRMIVPLGERYEQVFYLFEKTDGELVKKKLLPALFVPMTGISEDNRRVKPDPANPQLHNGGFEIDSDGDGHPDGWHYQRQLTLETRGAPEGQAFITFENHDPGRGAQALQGFAVDAAKVQALSVGVRVRGENLRNGPLQHERPAVYIQFYDSERRQLEMKEVRSWTGTFDWKHVTQTISVPPKSREAIIRVGLNGATGRLSIDDIELAAQKR